MDIKHSFSDWIIFGAMCCSRFIRPDEGDDLITHIKDLFDRSIIDDTNVCSFIQKYMSTIKRITFKNTCFVKMEISTELMLLVIDQLPTEKLQELFGPDMPVYDHPLLTERLLERLDISQISPTLLLASKNKDIVREALCSLLSVNPL